VIDQNAYLQRCAAEILGEAPVTWPAFYHKYSRKKNPTVHDYQWDLCTTVGVGRRQLIDWTALHFWDPLLCFGQVFYDAWTKDGQALVKKGAKCIKARGQDTVPLENVVSNASVGQLPKFSVYTSAQECCGVEPFFTVNSCTGGRGGGFEGFVTWIDGLLDESTVQIRRFAYYNHPEAISSLPATYKTDPFTATSFRVRSPAAHQPTGQCLGYLAVPCCQWSLPCGSEVQSHQRHMHA
jgi:hypothetical protein